MVAPLLIPLLSGSVGVAAGWLAGGKSKKEMFVVEKEIHATKEHYAPQMGYAPVYAPQTEYGYQGGDVIIHSPGATTKKEMKQEQTSMPVVDVGQTARRSEVDTDTEGLDITKIAIIAVVGLIGYGAVTSVLGKQSKHVRRLRGGKMKNE